MRSADTGVCEIALSWDVGGNHDHVLPPIVTGTPRSSRRAQRGTPRRLRRISAFAVARRPQCRSCCERWRSRSTRSVSSNATWCRSATDRPRGYTSSTAVARGRMAGSSPATRLKQAGAPSLQTSSVSSQAPGSGPFLATARKSPSLDAPGRSSSRNRVPLRRSPPARQEAAAERSRFMSTALASTHLQPKRRSENSTSVRSRRSKCIAESQNSHLKHWGMRARRFSSGRGSGQAS